MPGDGATPSSKGGTIQGYNPVVLGEQKTPGMEYSYSNTVFGCICLQINSDKYKNISFCIQIQEKSIHILQISLLQGRCVIVLYGTGFADCTAWLGSDSAATCQCGCWICVLEPILVLHKFRTVLHPVTLRRYFSVKNIHGYFQEAFVFVFK